MSDSGIYVIKNLVNGKPYFGSTNNFSERFYSHKYNLRKNDHGNQHLQNSWNKYGEVNFDFIPIDKCKDYKKNEQKYLDFLFENYDYDDFYNDNRNAHIPDPMKGEHHPGWKGGKVEIECEFCGKGYKVDPYKKDKSKYCSTTCRANEFVDKNNWSGEGNPNWTGGKDEIKCDNCGEIFKGYDRGKSIKNMNLRFCGDSCRAKYYCSGETHPQAVLDKVDVKIIKYLLHSGDFTQKDISKIFGVANTTISSIKRNKTWSNISVEV